MTTQVQFGTPPPRPSEPTSPRLFGKYVLLDKLAEGGMAELFLAKQLGTEGFERDVVIKCMHEQLSRSQDFVNMFLDEARLAAKLHHPNIVQITDLGVAEGRYFICMEYLPGEDLESVQLTCERRGEKMPIPIATRIILSACAGLELAHGLTEAGRPVGLVHRDISPSNVIVTYQGMVKLVDFGIAKAASKLVRTEPGTIKGKWGYMSPEQARGESVDARSDIFSLGVTFHELLTGKRVFDKSHEMGVLIAMMEQPIPRPSDVRREIPPELDRIVMRALAKRPFDRYPSVAALSSDLEHFFNCIPAGPGNTQLSRWIQTLFGPERVGPRLHLPTLADLAAKGVTLPEPLREGLAPTFVRGPGTDQLGEPPERTPSGVTGPRDSHSKWGPAFIGAAVAVVLLVGAAFAGIALKSRFFPAPAPVQPEIHEVISPAAVSTSPPRAAPASRAEPIARSEAMKAASPPPARTAHPAERKQAPRQTAAPRSREARHSESATHPRRHAEHASSPSRHAHHPLTLATVHRLLRAHGKSLVSCGYRHEHAIPSSHVVRMEIAISHAGRVTEARPVKPSRATRPLTRCLAHELKKLRFPRNDTVPALSLSQPFRFNVH